MANPHPKSAKNKTYKARTLDGRAVKNLRPTDSGWTGFVDGVRMVWDEAGGTGKGVNWTLSQIE